MLAYIVGSMKSMELMQFILIIEPKVREMLRTLIESENYPGDVLKNIAKCLDKKL